ncbi:hypothetical protein KFK09_010803 [Dendrobium nobile]|uniref:Uncharacterized protein n=1 Tax=Dendrobium nobile TaxID=94219 RepID=A0A8T3BAY6_DENNO|nr:hypothetical protein KFK09_010803 [Dendrobium nobile]
MDDIFYSADRPGRCLQSAWTMHAENHLEQNWAKSGTEFPLIVPGRSQIVLDDTGADLDITESGSPRHDHSLLSVLSIIGRYRGFGAIVLLLYGEYHGCFATVASSGLYRIQIPLGREYSRSFLCRDSNGRCGSLLESFLILCVTWCGIAVVIY